MSSQKQIIGTIGVDTGRCLIGDPCYTFEIDWDSAAESVVDESVVKLGQAVCVQTGYGDGLYPVFAKFTEDGRIASVEVVFIDDTEEAGE